MFKNIIFGILAVGVVVAIGGIAYSTQATPAVSTPSRVSAGNGVETGNGLASIGAGTAVSTPVLNLPAATSSADESAAVLFMCEEEKLAHDVYNFSP